MKTYKKPTKGARPTARTDPRAARRRPTACQCPQSYGPRGAKPDRSTRGGQGKGSAHTHTHTHTFFFLSQKANGAPSEGGAASPNSRHATRDTERCTYMHHLNARGPPQKTLQCPGRPAGESGPPAPKWSPGPCWTLGPGHPASAKPRPRPREQCRPPSAGDQHKRNPRLRMPRPTHEHHSQPGMIAHAEPLLPECHVSFIIRGIRERLEKLLEAELAVPIPITQG